MDAHEIANHIKVIITPEGDSPKYHNGDLPPGTTFWLHTFGMEMFGLPNLEVRRIPVWGVPVAHAFLNYWAAYSTEHDLSAGELVRDDSLIHAPVVFRTLESADDFWKDKGPCLRMEIERIVQVCMQCVPVPASDIVAALAGDVDMDDPGLKVASDGDGFEPDDDDDGTLLH